MSLPVSPPGSTPALDVPGRSRRRVRAALHRFPDTVRAYVGLTKTRIIEQLLVVTVPAMFLAERGVPPVPLILATLVGGTGAAASAHALNCVIDADIDVKMKRTARRPLARGQVPPSHALVFGLVLAALSTVWLWLTTNQLAAGLALTAIAFYVLVYTLILKRRTAQNIVWGGAAGCMPVVIGWAAVTGEVGWPALVMFGVIFFWTPPHYWPLSMKFRDDYEAAQVPMLPVVARFVTVARQIVAYSWVMVLTSLALVPVARMGWVYAGGALVAGGLFLAEAHRLHRHAVLGSPQSVLKPMRLFHYSITYLTILFVAVAIDPLLYLPVLP